MRSFEINSSCKNDCIVLSNVASRLFQKFFRSAHRLLSGMSNSLWIVFIKTFMCKNEYGCLQNSLFVKKYWTNYSSPELKFLPLGSELKNLRNTLLIVKKCPWLFSSILNEKFFSFAKKSRYRWTFPCQQTSKDYATI